MGYGTVDFYSKFLWPTPLSTLPGRRWGFKLKSTKITPLKSAIYAPNPVKRWSSVHQKSKGHYSISNFKEAFFDQSSHFGVTGHWGFLFVFLYFQSPSETGLPREHATDPASQTDGIYEPHISSRREKKPDSDRRPYGEVRGGFLFTVNKNPLFHSSFEQNRSRSRNRVITFR